MQRILRRQGYHLLAFAAVGTGLDLFVGTFAAHQNQIWGLSARGWTLFSWVAGFLFQTWIVLIWRLEYHYRWGTSVFGSAAFTVHRVGFVFLGAGRFLALIPIALSTAGTLRVPRPLTTTLIVLSTPAIVWGLYSVVRYFGLNRAFGADHFDPDCRQRPLENRGVFRYIPNGMYTIVLLLVYHPGLAAHSTPALVAGLAHHLLVWCHYFCTEKPDMQLIYGNRPAG